MAKAPKIQKDPTCPFCDVHNLVIDLTEELIDRLDLLDVQPHPEKIDQMELADFLLGWFEENREALKAISPREARRVLSRG